MEIKLTQSYLKNFASKTSLIKNPSGTAPNCTSSKLFHFGNWLMQSFDEKQNLYYNGNNINHSGLILMLFSGMWTRRSRWRCGGRGGGGSRCLLKSTFEISSGKIILKFWWSKNSFIWIAKQVVEGGKAEGADASWNWLLINAMSEKLNYFCLPKWSLNFLQ